MRILLVVSLLVAGCATTPDFTPAESGGLTFIHLNDTYRVGAVEDGTRGGFGRVVTVIRELQQETGIALLLITHDLGVVAGNCQRVLVMDHGNLVEEGNTREVFKSPASEQTRTLLSAAPAITSDVLAPERPAGQHAVMSIDSLAVSFRSRGILPGESINALRPVSFEIGNAETVAVVGESGSGKTSLVRAALGLVPADSGKVSFLGEVLPATLSRRKNDLRRQLQMVFQDPIASLNPAMTVQDIVVEPLLVGERGMNSGERRTATTEMLARVGLDASLGSRYAHELSGGQAQRVAIARALITRPKVLVCDEAVAALDGTVQHEILNLLIDEQRRSGLSIIFITHDLAVVRQIAHRVLVIYMGRLCEVSGNDSLFARPRHPYSKALINAVPVPDPDAPTIDVPLQGETASMLNPPAGCPFHPRCPHAIAVCSEAVPEAEQVDGATVACHRASELDLSY